MDPTNTVALVCAHQDTIVNALAWMGGVMPVASALAWATARWNKMPAGLQTMLQVAAGNLLHAALGEPQAAPHLAERHTTPAAS
jgi:hypothetical protein